MKILSVMNILLIVIHQHIFEDLFASCCYRGAKVAEVKKYRHTVCFTELKSQLTYYFEPSYLIILGLHLSLENRKLSDPPNMTILVYK